jgi:hypothetical protein
LSGVRLALQAKSAAVPEENHKTTLFQARPRLKQAFEFHSSV